MLLALLLNFVLVTIQAMPDSLQSLRKSNRDLKKQLDEAKQDLKRLEENFSAHEEEAEHGNGAASLSAEAEKSFDFLGKEYDDLPISDSKNKRELSRISNCLDKIDERLGQLETTIENMQEYSYGFKSSCSEFLSSKRTRMHLKPVLSVSGCSTSWEGT